MKNLIFAFALVATTLSAQAFAAGSCEKEAAASAVHYVQLYIPNGDSASVSEAELVHQDDRGQFQDFTFRILGALYSRTCTTSGGSCNCDLE